MQPIRALVTSTDDPEGLGRIEISSPEMGDYWPAWAAVVQAYGPGGAALTPSVGDQVLVAFLDGDRTWPVVLGRLGG